jgi:hypothetical protein
MRISYNCVSIARSNIVVDEKGMVRVFKNHPLGKLLGIEEVKDFLDKMPKIK